MLEKSLFIESSNPAISPHRIAYYEWENPAASKTVICVHGLTRNGRDFDYLAQKLSETYRVISVDMPGRGKSDYLLDPLQYNYFTYIYDMQCLLASLGLAKVYWVGTSMGGIICMMLAPLMPGLIEKLVLNDIGCLIPAVGLKRIFSYAGVKTQFASMEEARQTLRENMASFGITDEIHWQHLYAYSLIQKADGSVHMHYDAAIALAFQNVQEVVDVNLWGTWEAIKPIPTLLIRGAESDILTAETSQQMQALHGNLVLREIANTGHAPMLMEDPQIKLIDDWLKN